MAVLVGGVYPGSVCSGCLPREGVWTGGCLPREGVCLLGVCLGGVWTGGVCLGGFAKGWGVCPGGMCPGRVYIEACGTHPTGMHSCVVSSLFLHICTSN